MDIVTICGSMRFYNEMLAAAAQLTREGAIVLMPFLLKGGSDGNSLDELHRQKIELAQRIIVVCPGGYIGQSTQNEIAFAEARGKSVSYFK